MMSMQDPSESVSTKSLEAQELYAACRDELQQLKGNLREHDAKQEELSKQHATCQANVRAAQSAVDEVNKQHSTCRADVCGAQNAVDDAKAQLRAAEEKLKLATQTCEDVEASVGAAGEKLKLATRTCKDVEGYAEERKSQREKILALIEDKADELLACKSHAESMKQTKIKPASSSVKETDEVKEVTLNSWTVGQIWCPEKGWVSGYPHADNPDRTQRFIMHLDSGNSAITIISQAAFDFMGLSRTAVNKGMTQIRGVTGTAATCPVYEIKICLDVVNSLKPGTIKQRTMRAAVQSQQLHPGQVGYYDLLLSAEDSQKLAKVTAPGRKLRFEMLKCAPSTLYDGRPLNFRSTHQSTSPHQLPRSPSSNLTPEAQRIMDEFFGRRNDEFLGSRNDWFSGAFRDSALLHGDGESSGPIMACASVAA